MLISRDTRNQPFIEWEQSTCDGGAKRAWMQQRTGENDWAGTGRYINVVRCVDGRPAGNATDFPVWSSLPDDQLLIAFVASICAITGCPLPTEPAERAPMEAGEPAPV
jgi:hypothetical protein